MSSLAILLEQTQAISLNHQGRLSHFLVYGCLIIWGILMSNLYKGDNITRLTLPATPIPYKYLNELIRDNFTLYTLSSPLHNILEGLKVTYPPMISDKLEEALVNHMNVVATNRKMIEKLGNCKGSGVAAIVPEENGYQYAFDWRNLDGVAFDDVSIGTEKFAGIWRGIVLKNNADHEIAERTKKLEEADILAQWIRLWARRIVLKGWPGSEHWARDDLEMRLINNRHKKKSRVWKTNLVLEGSILTLFVVLGFGWVIAILACVTEITFKFKIFEYSYLRTSQVRTPVLKY